MFWSTLLCEASSPNTEILQFDWFISRWIFPGLPSQEGGLKKTCLCTFKIFDIVQSENVLRTIRKATMQSEVDEEILYGITTGL